MDDVFFYGQSEKCVNEAASSMKRVMQNKGFVIKESKTVHASMDKVVTQGIEIYGGECVAAPASDKVLRVSKAAVSLLLSKGPVSIRSVQKVEGSFMHFMLLNRISLSSCFQLFQFCRISHSD